MEVDICSILNSLDFSKKSDLERILSRDKHTRIEGLYTEIFFYEQLIKNNFTNYTSGFWFGFKEQKYSLSKLLPSLEDITNLDYQILNIFYKSGIKVFIVFFSEKNKTFFYLKYNPKTCQNIEHIRMNAIPYPKCVTNVPIPRISERNPSRHRQAFEFLNSYNHLKRSAVERAFANCYIGNGSFWDIDYFVNYKNTLYAFEVKQKYPTAKGTFGLNVGLTNLFHFINNSGIKVIHVILTKPVNDYNIPSIDFYTKPEYKSKSYWIATKVTDHLTSVKKSLAPSRTSIYGTYKLGYYDMQPSSFHFIKKASEPNDKLIDFIEDKTNHLNTLSDLNSF